MDPARRQQAVELGARVAAAGASPAAFRAAVEQVRPADRDGWLDLVLGLDELPADGPALPRGCVPYLPCPVDVLLEVVDHAPVTAGDVFVDVGAGVGRAAALVHLVTGAAALAIEIQPELAGAARALLARLAIRRVDVILGDVADAAAAMAAGTVFFLYCPFSGARLDRLLDDLEPLARARELRIAALDLPLPARRWLVRTGGSAGLDLYRTIAPG